jgi:hypothetical protein
LPDRNRLRTTSRVTVRKIATPRAISPATWEVNTGARVAESATGETFFWPAGSRTPGDGEGLGVAEGEIAGNRPDTLPAPMSELETPMSELETPLRSGRGPSGSAASCDGLAEDLAGEGDADDDAADAEVTATVAAADGAVHFTVVTTLAVAVSVTELTEVALDATGIWAGRSTGCLSDTVLRAHVAVAFPLAQPLVNAGFSLAGCVVSVTDTSEADPFSAETVTT